MIKYRTGGYDKDPIKEVEVERETESSIWIDGVRSQKISSYHKYWDTWEEAHAHLLQKAEQSLEHARSNLESATERYAKIVSMKAP